MIPKPGLLSELAEGQNRDSHRLQESSVGQNANSLISDVSGIFSELQGARKSFVPEERKKTMRGPLHIHVEALKITLERLYITTWSIQELPAVGLLILQEAHIFSKKLRIKVLWSHHNSETRKNPTPVQSVSLCHPIAMFFTLCIPTTCMPILTQNMPPGGCRIRQSGFTLLSSYPHRN